jgi:hypothetical protein
MTKLKPVLDKPSKPRKKPASASTSSVSAEEKQAKRRAESIALAKKREERLARKAARLLEKQEQEAAKKEKKPPPPESLTVVVPVEVPKIAPVVEDTLIQSVPQRRMKVRCLETSSFRYGRMRIKLVKGKEITLPKEIAEVALRGGRVV